ncbi:MAG: sensor histidine kinase [Oscillospiraceae bacterium]
MQELSLNILDIAQNSIKANASLIEIIVEKNTTDKTLKITINDNGCGMSKLQVEHVVDPFYTTRTTRKVGLGVPFFKMTAQMTGGTFLINSTPNIGTNVVATYNYEHLDMLPLGDMPSTMMSLVCVNPNINFIYKYIVDNNEFCFDTFEIKKILDGVLINSPEILTFIKDFIAENQASIK